MKQLNRFTAILAAALLLSAVACAPTPTREGTGEYMDDTLITTKVKSAILVEPGLKSSEINVETFKGRVQLSGFVKTWEMKTKAEDVTREVKGVQSITNDIQLR